jgi:cyclohexanone monooxygenase
LRAYSGRTLFTGRWPKEGADLAGKRICVIGTGSSAIQAIPEIAKAAAHLTVFQRTANFSIPARNAPLTPERVSDWKGNLREHRRRAREEAITGVIYKFAVKSAQDAAPAERQAEFEDRWRAGGAGFMHAYNDLLLNEDSNRIAADFVRDRIRAIVKDARTAERLCPGDHPIGTKRICVDSDYFDTFNRLNVDLVSLKETGGLEVGPEGVKAGGALYPCDVLVLATGFDAITGPLLSMDVRGRDGRSLRDKWNDGPKEYLGLVCAGFPNLLTITGPGSPSVISNVIVSIEQHVDFIANLLGHMRAHGYATVDANAAAEEEWMMRVSEIANATLYPKANSWYVGANVPGKPRGFMAYIGVAGYRKVCDEIAADGYRGFEFSA